MLHRDHQHLVINVSIAVDEKVNKIGPEGLILAGGIIKGGDTGGIPSLRSGISKVCRLVEDLSRPKIISECAHEVYCLAYSVASPINCRSCSFCVTGERVYDYEVLLNMTNICENLPRRLNSREHYHSHLTTVVPGGECEEVIVVLQDNRGVWRAVSQDLQYQPH